MFFSEAKVKKKRRNHAGFRYVTEKSLGRRVQRLLYVVSGLCKWSRERFPSTREEKEQGMSKLLMISIVMLLLGASAALADWDQGDIRPNGSNCPT